MDDAPTFKGFDILETLPRGGMSTVYKARQISLDRIVALKVLPPDLARRPKDIDKFIGEARITAALKHPNIVQVYDFGRTEDGIYYFVMEFISGHNVAHWIRRKQRISLSNTLLIAQGVAEALKYAWERDRIIHCDIKPDNIMVDNDGSIKVADLGLARSIHSVADKSATDVIFGTPNYIAPEQSRGDSVLDCRTDIYALGATIYHCLTGQIPFANLPPQEIMEQQITGTIPDPQEIYPAVATAAACLIEKMMCKDPADRQSDWDAIIQDIIRVQSGELPEGNFRRPLPSTVQRCHLREKQLRELYHQLDKQTSRLAANPNKPTLPIIRRSPLPVPRTTLRADNKRAIIERTAAIMLLTLVLGLSGMIIYRRVMWNRSAPNPAPALPEAAATANDAPPPAADEQRDRLARELYDDALQWLTEHPARFDEAIRKFDRLAADTKGTPYASMAMEQAKKLRQGKARAIKRMLQSLQDHAEQLGARHHYAEAAVLFSEYKGEFAKETYKQRQAQAEKWQARAIAHQQEKQTRQMATESQWSQVLAAISDAVLTEKFDSIAELLQTSFADSNLAEHRLELREMESLCRAAAGLNQRLLATFLPQKGLTITLRMKQGTEQRTIREVTGTSILTENISPLGSGYVIQPQTVTLDDLTLMELQERLGAATTPETSLLRGILAMRDKNFDAAARAFEDVGEPLGPVLTGAVAHHCSRQREKEAWTELSKILARAQIHVKGPLPDGQLAAMLKQRKLSEMEMRLLHQAVAVFQTRYTGTDCARQAEALWKAASPDAANTIKVAIETEADTYDALLANLNNHNPGLQQDEIICWLDWQDRPERLEIISPNLRTLQPLEQLPSLRELICGGQRPGNRSDTIILAPLDDLTPLRYLPIRTLSVAYTRVKNLAPIKDMVSLTRLSLAQTDVADLTQLAALHLTALDLSHTKINDLTPLQNMPLRELNLNHTDISDLAVLRGKHLTDLRAAYTRIRDLTPLSNIPLSTLDIRGVAVSDLSPLAGMPLERLELAGVNISDLGPLRNMPLKHLDISGTGVKNIHVLRGMPLRFLNIQRSAIKDLSPLQNAGIEEIWLDYHPYLHQLDTDRAFTEILRQMPALTTVNGMPWRPPGEPRKSE